MKRLISFSVFTIIAIILVISCRKPEDYPINPVISFERLFIMDSIVDELGGKYYYPHAVLEYTFTDGDGDIGLSESDTNGIHDPDSMYYFNLFLTMYEKNNGVFDTVEFDEFPLSYRIPYIERKTSRDVLKGNIIVDIVTNILFYDTIKFDFYMVDRALHSSNKETTSELVIEHL